MSSTTCRFAPLCASEFKDCGVFLCLNISLPLQHSLRSEMCFTALVPLIHGAQVSLQAPSGGLMCMVRWAVEAGPKRWKVISRKWKAIVWAWPERRWGLVSDDGWRLQLNGPPVWLFLHPSPYQRQPWQPVWSPLSVSPWVSVWQRLMDESSAPHNDITTWVQYSGLSVSCVCIQETNGKPAVDNVSLDH